MKPEPLKDKGRWTNEDLCLEYAQCAIEKPELREHLIELWHSDKDILSAVEWLKGEVFVCHPFHKKLNKLIDKAFQDVVIKK